MNKFANIINTKQYKGLETNNERIDYFIEKGVYVFLYGAPYIQSNPTPQRKPLDQNRKSSDFFKNIVYKAGFYFTLSPEFEREFITSYKHNIAGAASELATKLADDLRIEWSIILDKKDRLKAIKDEYKNNLQQLLNIDFSRNLYRAVIDKDQNLFTNTVFSEIWENSDEFILLNYLIYGKFRNEGELSKTLSDLYLFEVNLKLADILLNLIEKHSEREQIQNIELDNNRFPNIFTTAYDCELFHYSIKHYQGISKRTYSIFYQWFTLQNKIKSYRGIKSAYRRFVCDNFEEVSKIEVEINRDLSEEFNYLKKAESDFKVKL